MIGVGGGGGTRDEKIMGNDWEGYVGMEVSRVMEDGTWDGRAAKSVDRKALGKTVWNKGWKDSE
jgi:hypothetical protein